MFNFFRLASRARVTWADKGPLTDNRGPPGATSGPLFPSHMTLQYSNWVGPILSSSFRVAAKLTFSDWPQAPWGPKRAKKALLGPPTEKMECTAAKPPKFRSFWHQPISGSSFRFRATEFFPVASGRFLPFPNMRFGPGTPQTSPNRIFANRPP